MTSPESLGTASFLLALSPSCLVFLLVNMLHLRNAWICHLKLSSDDISTKKPVGIFPTISPSFRVLLHTLCIPHPELCLLWSAFLCLFVFTFCSLFLFAFPKNKDRFWMLACLFKSFYKLLWVATKKSDDKGDLKDALSHEVPKLRCQVLFYLSKNTLNSSFISAIKKSKLITSFFQCCL